MRNRKRAPRISKRERLLTETCHLALHLMNTLLQPGALTLNSPNSQPSTINFCMKPDNFEPSQDENLPSFQDVLKTADEHASIDQDLQDGLVSDPSTLNDQPSTALSPAKGESENAWIAFLTFLDLAAKGQVTNAAVAKATGTPISTIKYWSSQFRWRQRLHHLNRDAAEARVEATTKAQKEAGIDWAKRTQEQSERAWAITTSLNERISRAIDELDLQPENVTLPQVANAARTTLAIGRELVDRHAPKTEGPSADTTALRAQLAASARKAYAKAKTQNAR